MPQPIRATLLAAALFASATALVPSSPSGAQGASRCTNDSLTIEGQKVAAVFCIVSEGSDGANKPVHLSVSEALSTGTARLSRTTTLSFVAAPPARAIDDIPLGALGIDKTLHATFLYSGGTLSLEHALLVPGAVTVK